MKIIKVVFIWIAAFILSWLFVVSYTHTINPYNWSEIWQATDVILFVQIGYYFLLCDKLDK